MMRADLSYDGTTLSVTITDTITAAAAVRAYAVDIQPDRRPSGELHQLHRHRSHRWDTVRLPRSCVQRGRVK